MYKSFSRVCCLGVLFLLVACDDGNKGVDSKSQNNSSASEFSNEIDSNAKNAENKETIGEEVKDTDEKRNIEKIATLTEVEKGDVSKIDSKASLQKKSSVKYDGTIPENEEDLIELINAPMEDVSEGESVTKNENTIDQSEETDLVMEQTDDEEVPVYEMDGNNEVKDLDSRVSAEFDSPMVSGEMSFPEVEMNSDSQVVSEDGVNPGMPIESDGATSFEGFSESDQYTNFETPTEEVNWAADEQQ